MVTARDADVGENSRLAYSVVSGDEMGLFHISDTDGLITWSELANETQLTTCSWTLSVRVTDHGAARQMWTIASLDVVVDDCSVDSAVHASSRHSAAEPGRLLLTDWHVFVVVVAIAACVVVVGTLLTVVVALRYCRRRRSRHKRTQDVRGDEAEGDVNLKLVPSPTPLSDVSAELAEPGCEGHVVRLLVIDQSVDPHRDVGQQLISALQNSHNYGSLQVLVFLSIFASHTCILHRSCYIHLLFVFMAMALRIV